MQPSSVWIGEPGERRVGKVIVDLRLSNFVDETNADNGLIAQDRVRSLVLREVLVDPGATTICLPGSMIAALGLPFAQSVQVLTGNGEHGSRMFGACTVSIMGRSAPFQCLELREGAMPLLGVIPLEALGIELDLRNQRLTLLPDTGPRNYIRA
jgi:predicted aspartyl protease